MYEWSLTQPISKLVKTQVIALDRLLCLDALVEEGDLDEDYRLRFGEFSRLMAADFVPSNKREF